jgi:hypothetical protein
MRRDSITIFGLENNSNLFAVLAAVTEAVKASFSVIEDGCGGASMLSLIMNSGN